MTTLYRGENSYFMGAQAFLLDSDREMASDWASKHVSNNPAIKWVLGRFAEADNPNNNKQAWALEDLRIHQPSIDHAPMNMVHQAKHIVGAYVATEMIYPTNESAAGEPANPYVEALGAFWRYYFPAEYDAVQKAHDEGSLYFSMECVAQSVTFEDVASGRKEEFPYRGPFDPSYGDWNNDRSATRWLNKPHFLAGALIVPPVKPGWSNATIKSLSQYMDQNADVAQQVYESVEAQSPHLSSDVIEAITIGLMQGDIKEEWAGMVSDSIPSSGLPKNSSEPSTDVSASATPQGGDMDKTYTEDDLAVAIAKALEPVQAELETFKTQADAEAQAAKIAEIEEAHAAEVAALQQKLDESVIAATAATEAHDAVVAWLESAAAEIAEAAVRAERTDERVSKVKEVANFSDEFVAENTERWVAMSDEEFDATVGGYAAAIAAAVKPSEKKEPEVDLSTAMAGERDTAGANDKSAVSTAFSWRRQGFDPRTV